MRRAISLVTFAAVLVLIPFFATWSILGVLERRETKLVLGTASEDLQEITAHLSRLAHPETACLELAERLSRAITWNGDLRGTLREWPADAVRLYLFDSAGKRVQRPGCSTGMTVASERAFGLVLRAAREGPFQLSAMEKSQAESFLGGHQMIPLLSSRPNHLHDFSFTGLARYVGWYQLQARPGGIAGHILLFIDQKKIDPFLLAARACSRIDRLAGGGHAFGWLDLRNSRHSGLGGGKPLPAPLAEKLRRLRLKPLYRGRSHLLALSDTNDGVRLFGMRRTPVPSDLILRLRSFLVVILLELFLVLMWAVFFGQNLVVPLRLQLLGWFGIAGVAGLAALIGFSHVYGQASQASLIRDNQNTAVRLLQSIDADFSPAFASWARAYRRAARDIERSITGEPASGSISSLEAHLQPFAKTRNFSAAFLYDTTDILRYKFIASPDSTTGNFANDQPKIIQALAQKAMDKFNSVPDEASEETTTGSRNMLNVLLARPVEQLIRLRGTLQPMTLHGVNATVFLDLLCTSDGLATAALVILHDTAVLEEKHLSATANNLERNTQHRLVALSKRSSGNLPAVPPSGLLREPDLERLRELLDLTGATQHRLGRIGGERMLVTAIPGRVMSDYHLFLLTPFQPIDDAVRAVSTRITLLAFAGTGFSLLLAWMFGGMLLGPMRILTEGIDRLVRMRLDEPVSVGTGDELQRIGDGVTAIMEDLHERSLAKTVQEQLISGRPMTGPGWHLQGWSRSASDIGGEIFDMLPLPDGRIAFMVGDVAARGVSAALVMAMAKTATRLFLDEEKATPTVVLSELDRYFRLHARRLSRVGMLLGIHDPATGCLRYAATGRLFPILLASEAAPSLLAVDGDGLGAGSSGRATPEHQLTLAPGDRLVICTDGVVDACDPAGRAAGSAGISDLLDGLRSEEPEHLGGRLWEALNAWQGGQTPADDQTVLLLAALPVHSDQTGEESS
ncbi:MAG TPA: PP2C family protein-serine/threonine phosphatase [Candidatus Ozemobacteraceae bacterium]|nr:PP2C family protein-serine/threonine phosphatase [Candidatus Ozemobacteraceae bacterium]